MTKLLLLDDDPYWLSDLESILHPAYSTHRAETVEAAREIVRMHTISLAIIDLFLKGNSGDELSNRFITDDLGTIPYLRLTSAPDLVPPTHAGLGVLHKHAVRNNPSQLLDMLIEILASRSS